MRLPSFALVLTAAATAGLLLAGCSDSNPVKAEASVVTGGLSAGNDVQVTAALAGVSAAVKSWQLENATLPTAAEFAAISGATSSGGRR